MSKRDHPLPFDIWMDPTCTDALMWATPTGELLLWAQWEMFIGLINLGSVSFYLLTPTPNPFFDHLLGFNLHDQDAFRCSLCHG